MACPRSIPPDDFFCQRLPLQRVLLSPWGIVLAAMAPITLGTSLLILAYMYFLESPAKVWLEGGVLHASSRLPSVGVSIEQLTPTVVGQTLLFIQVNRYVKLYYQDSCGRNRSLGLNEIYYGKEQFDVLVRELIFKKYAYLAFRNL